MLRRPRRSLPWRARAQRQARDGVIITSLAITRERERGTMENLLATPARPGEVMIGKIIPYIMVGYIQTFLILLAAKFIFHVPMLGSLAMLLVFTLVFAANLAVGITFSTIARNQLQAVQMSFFFFLPSLLLSGFMFPFRGMPGWAQHLGSILPLTHFLRLVRGILLKGNAWPNPSPTCGLSLCSPSSFWASASRGIGRRWTKNAIARLHKECHHRADVDYFPFIT